MFLFVLVFISFVISPATPANDHGRYRIYSCSPGQLQCLNETCVSSVDDCGDGEKCVLPEYPNHGTYTLPHVLVPHPGQVFKSFLLRMTCDRRYGVVGEDGAVIVNGTLEMLCVSGKLLPETLPRCVRYCTLQPDPSVRYKCRIPGSQLFIPCPQYVPHGTTVDPQCRAPVYYSPRNLLFMNCRHGSWDYIAKCEADCGRITPEATGVVINGTTVRRGELPWHAGIYTKTISPYQQICGGTLVSNNVVISAAHCFWNEDEGKIPASKFVVAVGKLYREWRSELDKDSQESDVKAIMIPERFQGTGSTLQSDLAALILDTPIVFEPHIKPVCLSFSRDFERVQLQNGNTGKVAGWGLGTGQNSRSDVLKIVDLPYVDYNRCFREIPPSFQQFITLDKFCAGYTNGTTVCKGDSGGGLVFPTPDQDTERYYLRGVVSAAPTDNGRECNDDKYATFTSIADYDDFIKEAMQGRALLEDSNGPSLPSCAPPGLRCDDGACVDRVEDCKRVHTCETGAEAACSSQTTNKPAQSVPSGDNDKMESNLNIPNKQDKKPVSVSSKRMEVPWHVGIYDELRSVPVCGGSIVSPLVVISTSACYRIDRRISNVLLVAAGQVYRRAHDSRNVEDPNVQYSYVQALFATDHPSQPNLAVLTLLTELVYNLYVQPVNLVYDDDFDSLAFRSIKLAGWDTDTEEITSIDLPYVKKEDCNRTLSPEDATALKEAICTGYFGPKHRLLSFEGSGLVYKETSNGTEQYFLRGVMSAVKTCGDKPNSCLHNFDSYVIFSELHSHERYLRIHFKNVVPIYNRMRDQQL